MKKHTDYILNFSTIGLRDISEVGGKNASLGEMFQHLVPQGINVPDGFAITATAYWAFLNHAQLRVPLVQLLNQLDHKDFSNLNEIGQQARKLIASASLPEDLQESIRQAFRLLQQKYTEPIQVAVRSSATAEDLPTASFAGQLESFLNISNEEELLEACQQCYASLFTNRGIKYREDNGFAHEKVALSIGVQKMVRSDLASAGVGFTLEPETGFDNVILISGSWGLGENVVKGAVNPDEYYLFKPSIKTGKVALINRKLGDKAQTMVYAPKDATSTGGEYTLNLDTPPEKRDSFVLSREEVEILGQWALYIEEYYERPMDIEWAKDGITGELYIVQARPETVHAIKKKATYVLTYKLKEKGEVLARGKNVGSKIAAGRTRILQSPEEIDKLQKGEVLVTEMTNPDWDPVLKKASAIVTDRGGRTSHAAIVARETGAVAVVGTHNATQVIQDGQEITVSCISGDEGIIYDGILSWEEKAIDVAHIAMPQTEPMFILADPDQAFQLAALPNRGVGLMRLEFVINNTIQAHPMALVRYPDLKDAEAKQKIELLTHRYHQKTDYFVDLLSHAVATIAAAFYPKDVIVRMSDFKTNEYANLIGGKEFEPFEENPMLGWRGASRYYHEGYKEAFRLECEAMRIVREEMGLENVKLMIPFCRTPEEGRKVVKLMADYGLKQGEKGLEIYVMVEIPSNVVLAEDFAEIFDGFSIGSNDLTQLTLGIGRDSEILANLFDVNNEAVKKMIADVIAIARKTHTKIGLCGQAPSDYPEFAQFLVKAGINSISFSPDALIKGIENINKAEQLQTVTK